jgi:hypothetical protein
MLTFDSRCKSLIRSLTPATAIDIERLHCRAVILFQPHWQMQSSNISIESPEIANATGDEAKNLCLSRLTARMRQRQAFRIHQAVAWLLKLYAVIPFWKKHSSNLPLLALNFAIRCPPGTLFTQDDKATGRFSGSALISTFRSFACMEALHKEPFSKLYSPLSKRSCY